MRSTPGRIVGVYEAAGQHQHPHAPRVDRPPARAKSNCPPTRCLPAFGRRRSLPALADALREVHLPSPKAELRLLNEFRSPAQVRLIFDEFFWLECGLALKRTKARAADGIPFEVTERVREQIKTMLPFKPTGAQRRVTQEIANDMKQPFPMNRLLQGDVGSGKTIVAAQAAVIAIENGYQVAIMAPTEILAAQHYFYFKRLFCEARLHAGPVDRLRHRSRKAADQEADCRRLRPGRDRHPCPHTAGR